MINKRTRRRVRGAKNVIACILAAIGCALFFFILANALIGNNRYGNSKFIAVGWMFLYGLLCFGIWRLIGSLAGFLQRYKAVVVLCVLTVQLEVLFLCVYLLQVGPAFDMQALYEGAVEVAQKGRLEEYLTYFCKFPNNAGGMLFLAGIFKVVSFFGGGDYNAAACVVNCVLLCASSGLVFTVCDRLLGTKKAFFALFLATSCVAVYLYAPIFYSDALSILFPILGYALYLRAKQAKSQRARVLFFIACGVVLSLGAFIKFTVIFMLIAIGIDLLLTRRLRKYLPAALCCVVAAVLVYQGGSAWIRTTLLDDELINEVKIPTVHWIMMGLTGTGAYNIEDYSYTQFFPNLASKQEAAMKVLQKRIEKFDPAMLTLFLSQKGNYSFGNGLYGADQMLDDNPQRIGVLHEYVIARGAHFGSFMNAAQGHLFFLYFLMGLAAFGAIRRFSGNRRLLAPVLAVVGLYLFLLLWEANSRYIFNYFPVFVVTAAGGIELFSGALCKLGAQVWPPRAPRRRVKVRMQGKNESERGL